MKIKSPAKINLSLNVVKQLPNKYHELDMINCTVSLFDIIKIKLTKKTDILVTSNSAELEMNKNNSIYQAIAVFNNVYPLKRGVKVHVIKNIPMEAGLGGGSSNAAATLLALNKLTKAQLSIEQLTEIAVKIGADVPYLLTGGWARVKGIGEVITRIDSKLVLDLLIVKPATGVKTKECFSLLKKMNYIHPNISKLEEILINTKGELLSFYLGNSLQEAASSLSPEINKTIALLYSLHFTSVVMTGSGSAVLAFSYPKNPLTYKKAIIELKKQGYLVYRVKTLASKKMN